MFNELPDGHYLNAGEFNTKALMFQVDFISGRTEDQKAGLIAALSRAGFQATGLPESEVRVRVVDFPTTHMGMAGGVAAKPSARKSGVGGQSVHVRGELGGRRII